MTLLQEHIPNGHPIFTITDRPNMVEPAPPPVKPAWQKYGTPVIVVLLAFKILSAMRCQFGGHLGKTSRNIRGRLGELSMTTTSQSDALVFFGATGDLAYKKIFPALQAMVKRGNLNVPVVGVAKAGWNLDQFRARAKDSLEKHGGVDAAAFEKLIGLLDYVDGDYQDAATFAALRKALKDSHRPAHYLAIPPVLFETVVGHLAKSDCGRGGRVIVEKPFGHDLASAKT